MQAAGDIAETVPPATGGSAGRSLASLSGVRRRQRVEGQGDQSLGLGFPKIVRPRPAGSRVLTCSPFQLPLTGTSN